MTTDRIQIINQDTSTATPAVDQETVGYITVKAEKGPIKPVLIDAGKPAKIHEYFGYTNSTYPEMQEALDFNSEFPVYISAPYDTTAANKTPVAYVTPAGIFARATTVDLTGLTLEDVAETGASITGINSFSTDQEVLIPVGYSNTLFGVDSDVASVLTYTTGANQKLVINLGFDVSPTVGELLDPTTTAHHYLNSAGVDATVGRVLQAPSGILGQIVIDIPGVDLLYLDLVNTTGTLTLEYQSLEIATHAPGAMTTLEITNDFAGDRASLTGAYAQYLSTSAITTTWGSEDFRDTVKVYWKAEVDYNSIYGTIYQKYLSNRTTSFTFPKQYLGNRIQFTASENITTTTSTSKVVSGSLLEQDVDGFGASLAFAEKLANQGVVDVVTVATFDESSAFTLTQTNSAPYVQLPPVQLSRGVRIYDDSEAGWVEAIEPEYEGVEIFINPSDSPSGTSAFFNIAGTQELSRCIFSDLIAPAAAVEALPQLTQGSNYIALTNTFTRKSAYTRESFQSNLSGAYGLMIGRIIDEKLGGAAPMFLNQGGTTGIGGQLPITGAKPLYKYTKGQLTYLDTANYNPIILDPSFGVMVTSQKTCKGGELSDWSYIGHTSAFLKFQRDVRDQVMIPQIGKPNNPTYRELRLNQVSSLFRPRTEGTGRIWAAGVASVDDSDEILQQRKFVLIVQVKVDIFSEGVYLYFQNVDQSTELG